MDMLASWVHVVIPTAFVVVCILLMLVILLQKGRGGGLSGAFGGGGGYSAFGAKTGDVFTWITVALTFLFILVACLGVWFYVPDQGQAAITAKPNPAGATSGTGQKAPAAAPTTQPG